MKVSSTPEVFPGESEIFATGWPLQEIIFMTMFREGMGVSLVRLVPIPNDVCILPLKYLYISSAFGRSSESEKTSRFVRGSIFSFL